jgi:hypothetical protein
MIQTIDTIKTPRRTNRSWIPHVTLSPNGKFVLVKKWKDGKSYRTSWFNYETKETLKGILQGNVDRHSKLKKGQRPLQKLKNHGNEKNYDFSTKSPGNLDSDFHLLILKWIDAAIGRREHTIYEKILIDILGIQKLLNLDDSFFYSLVEDYYSDTIVRDLEDLFTNGGNWKDNLIIKGKRVSFFEKIYLQTPPIGTPNANTGKGELLFCLLSPQVKKPKKDDIKIFGEVFDLKDETFRIWTDISGIELNAKMMDVCQEFGINIQKKQGFQMFSKKGLNHLNSEFFKQNLQTVKLILTTFFKNLFPRKETKDFENAVTIIVDEILDINEKVIVWEKFIDCLVFFVMENTNTKTNNIINHDETGKIRVLPKTLEDLKKLYEKKEIRYSEQFFRLFQEHKCAIYLKWTR